MNKRVGGSDFRYRNIIIFIMVLMILLSLRLFTLTILERGRWAEAATEQITKTLYTPSPRGNIYDRNGNLVAGNRQVFNVIFNASNLTTEEINSSSLNLVNKLIENKDEYIDDFPIKIDESGNFYYTYDKDQEKWLEDNGYSKYASAASVFESRCKYYDIDAETDRYEAMAELQEMHNEYLPINVRNMRFDFQVSKENFWGKFGLYGIDPEEGLDAEECFRLLRENYLIDSKLSDLEARKIFIVRNKVAANSYQRYLPLTIATDVSDMSVVYFKESNLPGVDIESSTVRYYPYGDVACHIIGYMGFISEGEVDYYVNERGYMVSDMVGKTGVEAAMEEKLHGEPGVTTIQVNSAGEYVSTLSEQEGKKGSDIYLTIDMDFQRDVQNALANLIAKNPKSRIGSTVVLDVESGDVLAMASFPTFDLNVFADGISDEEWAAVQPENPRDPLSPAPLYNNATMSAFAPGSTFKPLVALAALEQGLDPDRWIVDQGHIDLGDLTFGCSSWNEYKVTDGTENLELGIGNSCNYYFACIATGKDWGSNTSLGYDITIDDIIDEARKYGLYDRTGVEIGEISTRPVSAETKMENYKYGAKNALYETAGRYFPAEVYRDQKKLEDNINLIVSWIEENPDYWDLVLKMQDETDVIPELAEDCASMVKFDYFNQATWTTYDVFNTSIGQGDNVYTPVQMANYIATIGNHGLRNQVSVIYGVEGEGRTVKPEPVDTNTSEANRLAVMKGMRRVCTTGTLASAFRNFPMEVIGKTGTTEYQSIKQPADEVEYLKNYLHLINLRAGTSIEWEQVEEKMLELMKSDANKYPTENDTVDEALIQLSDHKITMSIIDAYKDTYEDISSIVAMAPYDNPEIALVVQQPEGGYGAESSEAVVEILNSYFSLGGEKTTDQIYIPTGDNGTNILQ